MVECARLEIVYTRKGIKGSNPFVSARIKPPYGGFILADMKRDLTIHNNLLLSGSHDSWQEQALRRSRLTCGECAVTN